MVMLPTQEFLQKVFADDVWSYAAVVASNFIARIHKTCHKNTHHSGGIPKKSVLESVWPCPRVAAGKWEGVSSTPQTSQVFKLDRPAVVNVNDYLMLNAIISNFVVVNRVRESTGENGAEIEGF